MKEYVPNPINAGDIKLPANVEGNIEFLARNVHENWSKMRMDEGWTYGEDLSVRVMTHPCLVEYEDLPEKEKEYDRMIVRETVKSLYKLGLL
jgi:ryanodine receptor 2